jgi:large subunit ribosomal protein L2
MTKVSHPKYLIKKYNKKAGRDKTGRISIRHRGGGAKRLLRVISTLDQYPNQEAKVISIDYDPNRSADIALLGLASGKKIYIVAPDGLKKDQMLLAGQKASLSTGNRMQIKNIPSGLPIYDLEIIPGSRAKLVRSAGNRALILAKEEGTSYIQVKLPSGEIRRFHENCYATLGTVSNPKHFARRISKAGIIRHMGKRPTVRGKAMHPAAHPHGGGEGVNPIGLKYPKTPWGHIARGHKTRKPKASDRLIIKRRSNG